jgi:hypothetical protein
LGRAAESDLRGVRMSRAKEVDSGCDTLAEDVEEAEVLGFVGEVNLLGVLSEAEIVGFWFGHDQIYCGGLIRWWRAAGVRSTAVGREVWRGPNALRND